MKISRKTLYGILLQHIFILKYGTTHWDKRLCFFTSTNRTTVIITKNDRRGCSEVWPEQSFATYEKTITIYKCIHQFLSPPFRLYFI